MGFYDDFGKSQPSGLKIVNNTNSTKTSKKGVVSDRSTTKTKSFYNGAFASSKDLKKKADDWDSLNPGQEDQNPYKPPSSDQTPDIQAAQAALEAKSATPAKSGSNFFQDAVGNVGKAIGATGQFLNTEIPKILDPVGTKALSDIQKKSQANIDNAVATGKLKPEEAVKLKANIDTKTQPATLTGTTKDVVDMFTAAPKKLGEQSAAGVQYQQVLDQMTKDGVITDKDYVHQKKNALVKGASKAGVVSIEQSGKILSPEADAKVKAKVKELTGVDYSYGDLLGSAVDTATEAVPGVGGAKAAEKGIQSVEAAGKAVQVAKDAATAADTVKAGQAFVDAGKPTTKLLSEPTDAFYAKERADVQSRLDSVNSQDQQYLKDNKLTTLTKSDSRKTAELALSSPERVQAHTEAAKAVTDADKQVQYYNDLKLKGPDAPYHRAIDKINNDKATEIEQLQKVAQDQGASQDTVDQLTEQINKKYEPQIQEVNAKYPEAAQQAPVLDDALKQASIARMQAHAQASKLAQEDAGTLKLSDGFQETADPMKIKAHTDDLQSRLANIDERVNAAKFRAENPAQTVDHANSRIDDITDPELSPESYDANGNLTESALGDVIDNQRRRAEASFTPSTGDAVPKETIVPTQGTADKSGLVNPTTGKFAENATYQRILNNPDIPDSVKSSLNNLDHEIHSDDILRSSASKIVDDDIGEAQQLFDSRTLNDRNPDGQTALGNALAEKYLKLGLNEQASRVIDDSIANATSAGRALRSFRGDIFTPAGIVRYAKKFAGQEGKVLEKERIKSLAAAAEDLGTITDPAEKLAAQKALKDAAENKGVFQRIKTIGEGILSIPRSIMTSGDLSFALRQGAVLGVRFPKIWAESIAQSAKMAVNPRYFEEQMSKVANAVDKNGEPLLPAYQDMKLSIEGVKGKSEEAFGNTNLLERKLNETGKGAAAKKAINKINVIRHFVAASDRSFTGAATLLRANVAKKIINDYGGMEKFAQWTKREKQDLGRMIDTASGRGRGGQFFEQAAPTLGQTLFSARLWKSRLDLINPVYYAQLKGPARKYALQGAGAFASTVAITLMAAKAAGADVEMDPRSSDFGKIKIGDTRYDIMGGLQQNIVLAAREVTGQKKNSNGDIITFAPGIHLPDSDGSTPAFGDAPDAGFGAPTRASVLGDFATNKTSPTINTAITLARGTDIAGNAVNPWQEVASLFIPLGASSISDKEANDKPQNAGQAIGNAAAVGLPEFFGVGTQTYGNNNTKVSSSDQKKIDAAPANETDMYKAFYTAAGNVTGRAQRDAAVSYLYKNNEPAKAKRKADEYNTMVDAKMEPFFSKYPSIDDTLKKELRDNLHITLTPAGIQARSK